jgi:hypothetical protein
LISAKVEHYGGVVMAKEKNPAAVALGKLGGSKGGKVRAARLSPERRSEIARKAVLARWAKTKGRSKKTRETK